MSPAIEQAATFSASAVLPYRHLAAATVGLRAELRYLAVDRELDWATFVVSPPLVTTDAFDQTWFEYSATVQTRS